MDSSLGTVTVRRRQMLQSADCTDWWMFWRFADRASQYIYLVHETAKYRYDDTRDCVMQFWPPDDEHMCSKHVEAWNKLIVKQKCCASSSLITEINDWCMFIDGYFYHHVVGNSTDTSKQGWLNLPKVYEPYQNSRHHKGDMKLDPFRGSTHIRCCHRTEFSGKDIRNLYTLNVCVYIYIHTHTRICSRCTNPGCLCRWI